MQNQQCENCAAFYHGIGEAECRLKAPTAAVLQGPGGQPVVLGVFPATKPENWCLEWRAKAE